MPIQTVSQIMQRIKGAPPWSPISVFVVKEGKNRKLDAIYGDTVIAKKRQQATKLSRPNDKCPTCGQVKIKFVEEWIGDFHQRMDLNATKAFLTKATEK